MVNPIRAATDPNAGRLSRKAAIDPVQRADMDI
jgi:hypothetical protein